MVSLSGWFVWSGNVSGRVLVSSCSCFVVSLLIPVDTFIQSLTPDDRMKVVEIGEKGGNGSRMGALFGLKRLVRDCVFGEIWFLERNPKSFEVFGRVKVESSFLH